MYVDIFTFDPYCVLTVDLGTENAYIKAWFMSQKVEPDQTQSVQGELRDCMRANHMFNLSFLALPGLRQWKPTFSLAGSFAGSPRRVHLYNAAGSTIGHGEFPLMHTSFSESLR